MTTLNAPTPRDTHKAVWTGSRMLIWGGRYASGPKLGGSYDPVADTWKEYVKWRQSALPVSSWDTAPPEIRKPAPALVSPDAGFTSLVRTFPSNR